MNMLVICELCHKPVRIINGRAEHCVYSHRYYGRERETLTFAVMSDHDPVVNPALLKKRGGLVQL